LVLAGTEQRQFDLLAESVGLAYATKALADLFCFACFLVV